MTYLYSATLRFVMMAIQISDRYYYRCWNLKSTVFIHELNNNRPNEYFKMKCGNTKVNQ